MCQFCTDIVSEIWKKILPKQRYRTPDLFAGKDYFIESKTSDQIEISPQDIKITKKAFCAAIHYLHENNHHMKKPCEIRSSNDLKTAGPLCKAARIENNNIRCINYILPILQKNVIAGVDPVRPNKTWLLVKKA